MDPNKQNLIVEIIAYKLLSKYLKNLEITLRQKADQERTDYESLGFNISTTPTEKAFDVICLYNLRIAKKLDTLLDNLQKV